MRIAGQIGVRATELSIEGGTRHPLDDAANLIIFIYLGKFSMPLQIRTLSKISGLCVSVVLIAACGGGGGGGGTGVVAPPPSGVVAQKCSANNSYKQDAVAATTAGSLADEKAWVKDYLDKNYLWYNEMPTVNAAATAYSNETNVFGSLEAYFDALLTPALTPAQKRKDQFSFIYSTKAWNELSQGGSSLAYGAEWYFSSSTAPRGIKIAYVEPNSPASAVGIARGDVLVSVDGVSADDSTQAGVNTLNAALFPQNSSTHTFVFSRNGANFTQPLAAQDVVKKPVLITKSIPTARGNVGYMVFNDHIVPAEQQLIDAINQLKASNVNDLILDLRYNGGGYLFIASELSYMIAGETRTNNKIFNKLRYNNKRTADNAKAAEPFYNQACILNNNFQCTSTAPLPTLNLGRVFVLTSKGTCSASEAIINGLEGIDVEVIRVGSTTCGKPYGFTAKDNCGISYFPIEFKGENHKGFGDFADGFSANCVVPDDFNKALGDETEGMLAAALSRRDTGNCPVVRSSKSMVDTGFLMREPVRENAIQIDRN